MSSSFGSTAFTSPQKSFGLGGQNTTSGFGSSGTGSSFGSFGSGNKQSMGFGSSSTNTTTNTFGSPSGINTNAGGGTTGGLSSGFSSTGFGSSSGMATSGQQQGYSALGGGFSQGFGKGAGQAGQSGFGSGMSMGGSFGGGFSQTSFGGQQQQQQQRGGQEWTGAMKINELRLAYAPMPSEEEKRYCEFRRCAYIPKGQAWGGQGTGHTLGQWRLWQDGDRENPDPENLEPVLEVGAAALDRRFEEQKTQAKTLKEYSDGVLSALTAVDKTSRFVSNKMEELQAEQARLYHKMLVVMRKLELFRRHGTPISADEQRYYERLDRIKRAMRIPNDTMQKLITMQTQLDRTPGELYGKNPTLEEEEKLCRALDKQREGLQHLTTILTKDIRDMGIIKKKLSEMSRDRQFSSN